MNEEDVRTATQADDPNDAAQLRQLVHAMKFLASGMQELLQNH